MDSFGQILRVKHSRQDFCSLLAQQSQTQSYDFAIHFGLLNVGKALVGLSPAADAVPKSAPGPPTMWSWDSKMELVVSLVPHGQLQDDLR